MLKMFKRGVWSCLLVSSMLATVFAYPRNSDEFGHVVGGIKIFLGGVACKEPCDDTAITSVVECDDVAGIPPEDQTANGCHKDRCTLNSARYVTCVEPANAGPKDADCEYSWDETDWWRWIIVRVPAGGCVDGGPHGFNYGGTLCSADGNGNPSGFTPCQTAGCTGPIFMGIDRAEPPLRRPVCD